MAGAAKRSKGGTLIVQPLPGIGDTIWHLPHYKAIARAAPNGRITLLTKGCSGICLITVCYLAIVFSLESLFFDFTDLYSFLWEQAGFRVIELSLAALILHNLWGATGSEGSSTKGTAIFGQASRTSSFFAALKPKFMFPDESTNLPPHENIVLEWSAHSPTSSQNEQ